jgi:hypothetical protein
VCMNELKGKKEIELRVKKEKRRKREIHLI